MAAPIIFCHAAWLQPKQWTTCQTRCRSRKRFCSFAISMAVDPGGTNPRVRRKLKLDDGEVIEILSRSVPITPGWSITVWELDKPATLMQNYWEEVEEFGTIQQEEHKNQRQLKHQSTNSSSGNARTKARPLDPFGLVAWPGSVVAARELQQHQASAVQNKTVLVLGAGPGVEALAAATLGARQVIATDLHPTTLAMLRYSAKQAGLEHIVTTKLFDICSDEALLDCDLLVVADVMYNPTLAQEIGKRCWQAMQRHNMTVLVSDSQRLADFVPILQSQLRLTNATLTLIDAVHWQERMLTNFSGSGVMIDEDQVYHVKARILWLGSNDNDPP